MLLRANKVRTSQAALHMTKRLSGSTRRRTAHSVDVDVSSQSFLRRNPLPWDPGNGRTQERAITYYEADTALGLCALLYPEQAQNEGQSAAFLFIIERKGKKAK